MMMTMAIVRDVGGEERGELRDKLRVEPDCECRHCTCRCLACVGYLFLTFAAQTNSPSFENSFEIDAKKERYALAHEREF